MDPRFAEHLETVLTRFEALRTAPACPIGSLPTDAKSKGGVYVLAEDGVDQYVGRASKLGQRMGNHLSKDPTQASLAVKMTREALGLKPTYRRGERFKDQMRKPAVSKAFD